MGYADKTAALFSELAASEKGYLKKFFKARIAVLPPKRAEQLNDLFNALENASTNLPGNFPEALQKEVFDYVIFGLEEYHKTDDMRARSYINQVEILLEKNLNVQGEKLLLKAKKLAKKEENYELLFEIVEWQIAIHSLKPPTDKNIKIFDEYFREMEEILNAQSKMAKA